MKTLIVFNHPYEGSYCNAILESAMNGLQESGQPCDLIHLDKDGFNPVMNAAELKAFAQARTMGTKVLKDLDVQTLDYAARLQQAEHLVLVFPVWWELMPALMKGFIDKLIFPAIAYGYTERGMMKSTLTRLKKVTVISTMNTPGPIYRFIFGNALRGALLMGTFRKIGCRNLKWISLTRVKGVTQEKRMKWLQDIKDYFKKA